MAGKGEKTTEVEKLLGDAKDLLSYGEFAKAVRKYDKVIKADPTNAEGYFGKAEASIGVPKMKIIEIAALYRKAIESDPDNPFYRVSYGAFCLDHGILQQAEEMYTKAAELDPECAHLHYSELAIGYYKNGIMFLDRQLNKTEEDIVKTSLKYSIKALNLEPKQAIELLSKME